MSSCWRGISAVAGPNAESRRGDARRTGRRRGERGAAVHRCPLFLEPSLGRGLQRRRFGRQQQGHDQPRAPRRGGTARAGLSRGASLPLACGGSRRNVTASGSGLDPDISPRGAQAQVRRVAEARGLDTATVRHLVDSLTQKPWLGLFGTEKVNVLRLNVALEELNEN